MNDFEPLKVTFHLDGTGVHYDPYEPPMLDGLIAWVNAPFKTQSCGLSRDDTPDEISLPLKVWHIGGQYGFHASALFPDGDSIESLLMWRKKFRQNRAEQIHKGSPNLQNGTYREYNSPLPLVVCRSMVAWCFGSRYNVRRSLKRIKFIGKKRAYGRGIVTGIDVEKASEDFSLLRDGIAMRWIPKADGLRLVRPRPPYWSNVGRVSCCEVGEIINE